MRSTKLTHGGRTSGILLLALVMLLASLASSQADADATELQFAKHEVLRLGESCPEGTRDVGWPEDRPGRLAVCRPDGFVPIATPLASEQTCAQARAAGVFGVWSEGDPISVCWHRYGTPVPATGCAAYAIETTLIDPWTGERTHACVTPVLVKGLSSSAAGAVVPICINDDRVLAQGDVDDLGVGAFFRSDGAEYVITSGKWCGFDCVNGFDINCDGKLGDFCPTEFDRRTVAGVKACLARLATDG